MNSFSLTIFFLKQLLQVLWPLISLGFFFYISNFCNYSATYGSLGGIIILLHWFFLSG
ncbi:YhjD/YihY/BrkB family envelope integrity protein [Virgibacillus proomii]|uniref:YhjD/YihY/BrkB family envelope integrity protein n=1 Tax=Virgibacillus proomii TaxID=84407 RepID=UPI0009841CBA